MVKILPESKVDSSVSPLAYQWDSLVRKHYNHYQQLIDAQTYLLQRVQRLLISYSYPNGYSNELLVLNLLRQKQQIGQLKQQEVDIYKTVNPNVVEDFNRTFNGRWNLPLYGMTLGATLLIYATVFRFTVPTQAVYFALPVIIDSFRIITDSRNQHRTLELLNWVLAYRRARCFNEKYHHKFNNKQTQSVLGYGNLLELGEQLIKYASK